MKLIAVIDFLGLVKNESFYPIQKRNILVPDSANSWNYLNCTGAKPYLCLCMYPETLLRIFNPFLSFSRNIGPAFNGYCFQGNCTLSYQRNYDFEVSGEYI